jgi:hypothetical protein
MEARTQLAGLMTNKDWGAKLIGGDANTVQQYRGLIDMAARTDDSTIAAAMSGSIGEMPDSQTKVMADTANMLREIGIPEGAIGQALKGDGVSEQEFKMAEAWKARQMKDPEFVKKYLNGDPEAAEKMTTANIIISGGIKGQPKLS